jgi:cytochrome c-type biogenesis protein CcmH
MKQRRSLLLLLALVALVGAAWLSMLIVAPSQPTLDQRVYEVGSQLKCPVCQNESVADSSAAIAEQMRLVIRQQLQEGKSEQEVLQYFAAHYGNQILLTPPQQGFNLLAWLMPVVMLLIGFGLLAFVLHDWRAQGRLQLVTDEEQEGSELQIQPELEQYRLQLEQELADEDPLMEIY